MPCGMLQNTLVVITSTHGMELFDHGGVGDARSLYDELIHVPLILRGPGVDPGLSQVSASLIDVMPTLCEFLQIEVPADVDGKALQQLDVSSERTLFCETDRIPRRCAASGPRYKLLLDLESGQRRLFDLLTDPAEAKDLADEPTVLGQATPLEDALEAFMGQ